MALTALITNFFREFKLVVISFGLALALFAGNIYLSYTKNNLVELLQQKKQGQPDFLSKGSNLKELRDCLILITQVREEGLWLDSLTFNEQEFSLELQIKAEDQEDIYQYIENLTNLLKPKQLRVGEFKISKKDFQPKDQEQNKTVNNELPEPFIVRYIRERDKLLKSKQDNKRQSTTAEANNIKWHYDYTAAIKLSKES